MRRRTSPVSNGGSSRSVSSASRTGVAVIGACRSGQAATRILTRDPGADVRWVCDLDRDRLLECQRLHPRVSATGRVERVLRDPLVEAIVIATPPPTRYRLATKALEAGKHVFAAEPVAVAAELLDELAVIAQEHDRMLVCGQASPVSPSVRAVRRALAAGGLGQIHTITSSGYGSSGTGDGRWLIAQMGPSEFAMVLYWMSEMPARVRAGGPVAPPGEGRPGGLTVEMRFASGVSARVALGALPRSEPGRITVTGARGAAVYAHDGDPFARLAPQLSEFLAAVRGNRRLEFEAAVGRGAVRICEAALTSLGHGGEDVPLGPEENRADILARFIDDSARLSRPRAGRLAA